MDGDKSLQCAIFPVLAGTGSVPANCGSIFLLRPTRPVMIQPLCNYNDA